MPRKTPLDFSTPEGRKIIRLGLMGKGGVGLASQATGIRYWRLSRILNGWLSPKESETNALKNYLSVS